MKTNGLHLYEAKANLPPYELVQVSFEKFICFIIAHFEHQGYTLEDRQPAPAGQFLLFQLDGMPYVAYGLSNPPLADQMWDVTSREVAWCASAAEILKASCGYVITRSRFSFGAEMEARGAGIEIVLVDGEELKLWNY